MINYGKIKDPAKASIIKRLENKPYIRYLRYLLSKGFSPSATRSSLNSLGYPALSIENIRIYFEEVLLPVANALKAKKVYSKYLRSLAKEDSSYPVITYKSLAYDEELQLSFCRFLKEIEVISLWANEISAYYAGGDMPVDENGDPLVSEVCSAANLQNILAHPRRNIIDQLLLDGNSIDRTLKKLKEEHMVKDVLRGDLLTYSRCFFDYQRKSLDDLAQQIQSEVFDVEDELRRLAQREMTFTEKYVAKQELEKRLQFLQQALKAAKADSSMMAFNYGAIEFTQMIEVFKEVFVNTKQLYDFHKVFTERENMSVLGGLIKNMQITAEEIMKLVERQGANRMDAKEALIEIIRQKHEDAQKQREIEAMGQEINFEDIVNSEEV